MNMKKINEIIDELYLHINAAYNTIYFDKYKFVFKGYLLRQLDILRDTICEIYRLETKRRYK